MKLCHHCRDIDGPSTVGVTSRLPLERHSPVPPAWITEISYSLSC